MSNLIWAVVHTEQLVLTSHPDPSHFRNDSPRQLHARRIRKRIPQATKVGGGYQGNHPDQLPPDVPHRLDGAQIKCHGSCLRRPE